MTSPNEGRESNLPARVEGTVAGVPTGHQKQEGGSHAARYLLDGHICGQGHRRGCLRLILRQYRIRWQNEMGFREMEVNYFLWRPDNDITRLMDELGRIMLYKTKYLVQKVDPYGDELMFHTFRDEVVE